VSEVDREQQWAELQQDGWRDWSPDVAHATTIEARMCVLGWEPVRDLLGLDLLAPDERNRLLESLMELKLLRMDLTKVI